jgi:hypothetical protein
MTAITEDWLSRVLEHGFIKLTCIDCGAEVRFRDTPAGQGKASEMVAAHKPSGCCGERQEQASGR